MVGHNALLFVLGALISTANGRDGDFLAAKKVVSSASLRTEFDMVLAEAMGHGHGVTLSHGQGVIQERLRKIHKTLDPLFHALPKNRQGHISAPVMRYAVRRYFSQTHGWIVKGFNPHGEDTNSSIIGNSTDIVQGKVPEYIRVLLENRFAHQGFSLDALVALVATVERMAFEEVEQGIERAFFLNDIDRTKALSKEDLKELISSYLITEMFDAPAFAELLPGNYKGLSEQGKHQMDKKMMYVRYPFWNTTILFLKDTVSDDIWHRQASLNPFAKQSYSHADALRIAERVSEQFGSWSNHECTEMKDMLMEMDVHATGRVKMSDFYSYVKDGAWQFLEPSEQLRQAGALDESSTWLGPQVMIPNYINSMSNCITQAPYYSICCLNECDLVFQQLESQIGAPSATADEIIRALEHGIYAAVNISGLHRERLLEIARVNHDQVPIYGRLFARWLHFVYPQECPYPHAAGVVKPLTQKQWRDLVGWELESATEDEMSQHLSSDFARLAPSPEAGASMWSLEESLLEFSTPSDSDSTAWSFWSISRSVVQVGMLGSLLSMLRPLMQMLRSDIKGKKLVEYDV
jgi:hypothetical protein